MWSWITDYSVWILMAAGVMLVIFLLFKERIQELIINNVQDAVKDRARKKAGIVFWTVEGIILGIITVAFAAITLSRTGIGAMITPQTIQEWFLKHGTSILIIFVLGIFIWYMLKKFLPLLLDRVMKKPRRGESREGMKRRKDTLVGVFTGLGRVIIILSVIFMVLSELAVPIGPILAGLGVAGIAVGFGAQYLFRDLIAGVFILIENQYRVGA